MSSRWIRFICRRTYLLRNATRGRLYSRCMSVRAVSARGLVRAERARGRSRHDVLIASWAGGGNLPPLLAAGRLLAARDHRVCVLTSAATRQPAVDAGFDVVGYRRAPDPEMEIAFEQQAA